MAIRLPMTVVIAAVMFLGHPFAAAWAKDSSAGWGKLEIGAGTAVKASCRKDRSGDLLITSAVEYETPVYSRGTLGLRLMPLFVYRQAGEGADTIRGGGIGLSGRLYQIPGEYRGWFAEITGHIVSHVNRINGNGANINFLGGGGFGYQFREKYHAVIRVEHISNGYTKINNAGVDTIGAAVGFSF